MKYPTLEEVEKADRLQICKWHRFLPLARDDNELKITNRVFERFKELGGMTPQISKLIGW